jgi:AraC-like DNA-binding protein
MAITYSTDEIHPRDRVAYWYEVVSKNLARHQFHSRVGSAFHGSVEVGALGALTVAAFESDPCGSKRSQRDAAHCYNDELVLSLQLAGRTLVQQDGREAILDGSSFSFMDMSRACTATRLTRTRSVVISIPRRSLEARLGNVAGLSARAMCASNPLTGLAAEFLALLPARLDALTGPSGSLVAEQALDLIALAYSSEASERGVTLSSPRFVALLRLKSVVESRLRDPELKPATVAAAAGISVRYANDLLSHEGFSVVRYIQHRRLERCRQALEDAAQVHRLISEIAFAWGFSDLSHFIRRFRTAYGMTPGDYRRRAQEASRREQE